MADEAPVVSGLGNERRIPMPSIERWVVANGFRDFDDGATDGTV